MSPAAAHKSASAADAGPIDNVDDLSDADCLRRMGLKPAQVNEDFSNVVVVDRVPIVAMDRFEKLKAVVAKIFKQFGRVLDGGLYLPVNEAGDKTLGYAFIQYASGADAANAVAKGDHKVLDKSHTLRVSLYKDFDRITSMDETYQPPTNTDYETFGNLGSWLVDDAARDQYVVRHANETEIYWNDPFRRANDGGRVLVYAGEREKERGRHWTELYVDWSPKGAYLVTLHHQGVVLWGGEQFDKLQKFSHPGVKLLQFSPNEDYLVTCNGQEKQSKTDPDCIIVWNTRTGKMLRGFSGGARKQWPAFSWSHDDRYLARVGEDAVSVYETPSLGLLDKKSIKCKNVQDCQFSPSDNVMCYIAYAVHNKEDAEVFGMNVPSSIVLMEVPSRNVIKEKNFFNCTDLRLYWHPQGSFLGVKIQVQKSKKQKANSLEIMRMRAKGVPTENMAIDDQLRQFAWEPHGFRFSTVSGQEGRTTVSIYALNDKKLKRTAELVDRATTHVYWAPTGQYLVMGNLGNTLASGTNLEFYDAKKNESLGKQEHFMCNKVEWDPSGRFVMTSVSQPLFSEGGYSRYNMENGYRVYTFLGEVVVSQSLEYCYQVLWRPRPASLLNKDQQKAVLEKLKAVYWQQFLQEDAQIRQGQLSGAARERAEAKEQWKKYRSQAVQEYRAEADFRRDLRRGLLSDDENDYVEAEVEVEGDVVSEDVEML